MPKASVFPFSLRALVLTVALGVALLSSPLLHAAAAPLPEWQEVGGKKFRGEPSEILGPFAVFRTGATSTRLVVLNTLSPEDCVRFHQTLTNPGERAAAWPAATGALSRELLGHTLRLQNEKLASTGLEEPVALTRELQSQTSRKQNSHLAPSPLDNEPEPNLFVIICGTQDTGAAQRVTRHFLPTHHRVQEVYPGEIVTLFSSLQAPLEKSRDLAIRSRMPWLIADPAARKAMPVLAKLTDFTGTGLFVVTRHGLPILSAAGNDDAAIGKFIDQLANLLRTLNADNPATWQARAHYFRAVRPVAFAQAQADPLLIGHPFRVDALRNRGITRIDGEAEVADDGQVTRVAITPVGGVTPELAPAFGAALQKFARFLPAIENGQPTVGRYRYQLAIPPVGPTYSAHAAWLGNEITVEYPIKEWLVLKTFNVDQQGNLAISHVDENGVTILKPVIANKKTEGPADLSSQKFAFADDWFSPEELAQLRPTPKLKQRIYGENYVWRTMIPDGPTLLLTEGRGREEYCYGYAWTEIEVPEDRLAWLGFGSDDGVKIWLNGEVLLEKWTQRPILTDEDVLPLRLKKGKNQLMLKVQNIFGPWSFACRLRVRSK